jgi:hypothetical protein
MRLFPEFGELNNNIFCSKSIISFGIHFNVSLAPIVKTSYFGTWLITKIEEKREVFLWFGKGIVIILASILLLEYRFES